MIIYALLVFIVYVDGIQKTKIGRKTIFKGP